MASRVSVTVNVRDNSRAGIRQVRNAIRRMGDDIRRSGGQADFRVSLNRNSTAQVRRSMLRLQRQLSGQNVTINAVVRQPDRNRFRRTILNTLSSPARTSGSILGGILSDGLGQGIVQGFKTAGPIGMAVLATAILGAVSVIGAALSGLLVTALGLAFVGIGGASAAMSEKVKSQWSRTLEGIKSEFKAVGEPLIPVLDRALIRLDQMAHRAGPKLREAIAKTAPATEEFLNRIMDGFESFAANAFQPIMDAWSVFAPVFGEEWDQFMSGLGDAFADMARLVQEHPTEIAAALNIVFDTITLLVRTITFFGGIWVSMMNNALKSTAFVIKAMANLAIATLSALGLIAAGAAKSLGWIPGIGDKLKNANSAFQDWKNGAIEKLTSVRESAEHMGGALDRANRKRKLEADIRQWTSEQARARASLSKTMSAPARKKILANIDDVTRKIASARRQLDALNGKTVVTWVVTNHTARKVGSFGSQLRDAHGGVVGHAATGGVRSNMVMVGEHGPEIVNLPPGTHVRSNPDTRRMLSGGGSGGGGAIALTVNLGGTEVGRVLVNLARREILAQGGNVQAVLGERNR